MALLRLIRAGTLVALGACGQAGAQPPAQTSGLTAPAGWRALPELAGAVGFAMSGEGIRLDGVEAWGEPAIGCYSVWMAMHGAGASAQEVLAGLEAEALELRDVVKPDGADGVVAASFEKPPYRGRLRARVATGTIVALACFANEREPGACDAACTTLLGGLP